MLSFIPQETLRDFNAFKTDDSSNIIHCFAYNPKSQIMIVILKRTTNEAYHYSVNPAGLLEFLHEAAHLDWGSAYSEKIKDRYVPAFAGGNVCSIPDVRDMHFMDRKMLANVLDLKSSIYFDVDKLHEWLCAERCQPASPIEWEEIAINPAKVGSYSF